MICHSNAPVMETVCCFFVVGVVFCQRSLRKVPVVCTKYDWSFDLANQKYESCLQRQEQIRFLTVRGGGYCHIWAIYRRYVLL